jgi:hypothetical protein
MEGAVTRLRATKVDYFRFNTSRLCATSTLFLVSTLISIALVVAAYMQAVESSGKEARALQ